jgi:hypothetical protein
MAKPSLMNLHILILILSNGHKISCPQQQLDTEALSQSETFCEEYSKSIGKCKKYPYIINQTIFFSKKYCEIISG